jgi:hypothetical protein
MERLTGLAAYDHQEGLTALEDEAVLGVSRTLAD